MHSFGRAMMPRFVRKPPSANSVCIQQTSCLWYCLNHSPCEVIWLVPTHNNACWGMSCILSNLHPGCFLLSVPSSVTQLRTPHQMAQSLSQPYSERATTTWCTGAIQFSAVCRNFFGGGWSWGSRNTEGGQAWMQNLLQDLGWPLQGEGGGKNIVKEGKWPSHTHTTHPNCIPAYCCIYLRYHVTSTSCCIWTCTTSDSRPLFTFL